jgi:hypothetical protein
MTPLLDEPRIAYANRKVQRFREEVETWQKALTPQGGLGAWQDLVRDANRLAQDLFALDQLTVEANLAPTNGITPPRPVATDIANWAITASRLIGAVEDERGSEIEGLAELHRHLETAKQIVSANPTERAFRELAHAWKEDTQYLSSITSMTNHWAYQKIIGLGASVVPLLLRELRNKPDFWFAALRAITGENPAPTEARGNVQALATAWLQWGTQKGLI